MLPSLQIVRCSGIIYHPPSSSASWNYQCRRNAVISAAGGGRHCRFRFYCSLSLSVEDEASALESEIKPITLTVDDGASGGEGDEEGGNDDDEDGNDRQNTSSGRKMEASGIVVPRQRYISVSKSVLLDAIVSHMFPSKEEATQFLSISQCLDSILHAEHKVLLEEMRDDYDVTLLSNSETGPPTLGGKDLVNKEPVGAFKEKQQDDETTFDKPKSSGFTLYLRRIIEKFSSKPAKRDPISSPRVAIPVRFQRSFMKLLYNAEFEELSPRDLLLTSALNTDYLLTLPIYVDWKRISESSAIIFRVHQQPSKRGIEINELRGSSHLHRHAHQLDVYCGRRGYTTERQRGLLLAEKLDYLQSKLLQKFFLLISKPLGRFGVWLNEVLKSITQERIEETFPNTYERWIKEFSTFMRPDSYNDDTADDLPGVDILSKDIPIWVAAQKAVDLYEGILSEVGPRERLLRKFLVWTGLGLSDPEELLDLDPDSADLASNISLHRQSFLSRISVSDIFKPASRKACGNDFQKMLQTFISILFSASILQEPAFQELVLFYTEESGEGKTGDKAEAPSLQMKIYEKIPIPDLPVVFPHKKLSFRILDTVRLDIATILGLLAYFFSYKFEDIRSSPSAIVLDVIAVTALIIYVSRVLLGYKQTRDRYQLLVNRTLYEKTVASGFGSIHFLIDASEQQRDNRELPSVALIFHRYVFLISTLFLVFFLLFWQFMQYKEAILVYAILLKAENGQVTSRREIGDKCETFIYNAFKEKIEVPVDRAIETLVRLGLVIDKTIDGKMMVQAISCTTAYVRLRHHWSSLVK